MTSDWHWWPHTSQQDMTQTMKPAPPSLESCLIGKKELMTIYKMKAFITLNT